MRSAIIGRETPVLWHKVFKRRQNQIGLLDDRNGTVIALAQSDQFRIGDPHHCNE